MDRIQIHAGQVWFTRSGQRVLIEEVLLDHGTTPVRSGDRYWQANGRYWNNETEHPKDLINQIQ